MIGGSALKPTTTRFSPIQAMAPASRAGGQTFCLSTPHRPGPLAAPVFLSFPAPAGSRLEQPEQARHNLRQESFLCVEGCVLAVLVVLPLQANRGFPTTSGRQPPRASGNHQKADAYRNAVRRKIPACYRHPTRLPICQTVVSCGLTSLSAPSCSARRLTKGAGGWRRAPHTSTDRPVLNRSASFSSA